MKTSTPATDILTDPTSGTLSERARRGSAFIADGRTKRRDLNRIRVIEAIIALADEGDPEPSIEAVADRANVSYRSIYRYFSDRTDLTLCALGHLIGDPWKIFEIDGAGTGPLEQRIERFVASRIRAYHELAPLTRSAICRAAIDPVVHGQYDRVRRFLREQLELQFAVEFEVMEDDDRCATVAALNVMFQFEAFESMVQHERFDDDTLAAVLTHHVRAHVRSRRAA